MVPPRSCSQFFHYVDALVEEVTTIPTVVTSLVVDATLDSFNETETKIALAGVYGVHWTSIVLNVSGGSIQITATIAADTYSSASALLEQVASISTTALSSALQAGVAIVASPQILNSTVTQLTVVREVVASTCATGHYCSAGFENPCPNNTYSGLVDQTSSSACNLCPTNSYSPSASTSIEQCICDATGEPPPRYASQHPIPPERPSIPRECALLACAP